MIRIKAIKSRYYTPPETEVLKKASKLQLPNSSKKKESISQREESPWKAAREYEERVKTETTDKLLKLFLSIRKIWLQLPGEFKKAADSDKLFRLNGKIYINPSTGKPLTEKQWDQVVQSIDKAFVLLFKDAPDRLVNKAMMLGKILQGMDYDNRIKTELNQVEWLKKKDLPADNQQWINASLFAKQHAGELISGLQSTSRKRITTTILDAIQNKKTSRQLERDLFDNFSDINRDWRRIAETELSDNLTNGLLLSEIQDKKENEVVYMVGLSAGNACKHCKALIDGQVVVLSDEPVSGGTIKIDGKEFPVIWPGKSNSSRGTGDYWPTIPLHPHCRCSWTRYYPEMAKIVLKKGIEMEKKILIKKSPTTDTRTCDWSQVSKEELYQSSLQHIHDVMKGLQYFQNRLKEVAENHDCTKLTYLDEFHNDFKTGFKEKDWYEKIHIKKERHHLAHPDGEPEQVDLIDVLEFIVDGVMAGKARSGTYKREPLPDGLLEKAFQNTIDQLLKLVDTV